jgi:carnosine N-methyltransferase
MHHLWISCFFIGMSAAEDAEEQAHYAEVKKAFRDYAPYMLLEVARRERHAALLSDEHKARLPAGCMEEKISGLKEAVQLNQAFLSQVADAQSSFGPASTNTNARGKSKDSKISAERHMSKIKSTLHQCCREWSEEAAPERQQSFDPLINELMRLLPVNKKNIDKQRVLVPGAGLGRLALEIAGKGYACQGNEFSYFMLETSNYLLNCVEEPCSIEIHPWIDQPSNVVATNQMLRKSCIPDVGPRSFFSDPSRTPDFSMCAGEFMEVYADQVRAGMRVEST